MFKTISLLTEKEYLAEDTYLFKLYCPKVAKYAKPGQFIHIYVDNTFTFRRPISICKIEKNNIKIVFKIKGKGTKKMAEWDIGKEIDILAPLGRGFCSLNPKDKVLLVGGGIGLAPLLCICNNVNYFKSILGFNCKKDIILKNSFEKYGDVLICTKDGSIGEKGVVTDFLETTLKTKKFNKIFSCGPQNMLQKVAEISKRLNIFCEISVEQRMACGIGACYGCQCLILKDKKITSAHVCKDGPIFNAEEFIF